MKKAFQKLKTVIEPRKLAVDFGTANCLIIEKGLGVVLEEPTVVAVSPKEKKIIAVGIEAKNMLGKVPEGIEARRPLKNGGIANYRLAEALLKRFFYIVLGRFRIIRPEVIVSIPAGINSVEERALIQAFHSVGAGHIYLFPEPVAAAVGAELPISEPKGNMIVNMGGGTSEIAVLSLNGIVTYESVRVAGDAINQAISEYLRQKHQLSVGELTLEKIKLKIASVMPLKKELMMEVRGKNFKTGQPILIEIGSNELVVPIRSVLKEIVSSIKSVLANCPPELISDLVDRGMVLSGGTALLRKIDEYLTKTIGIPAFVVEDPLKCVVKGLDLVMGRIDDYKRSVKKR